MVNETGEVLADWRKDFPKKRFNELIAEGKTEEQALQVVNEDQEILGQSAFHMANIVQLQLKDSEFKDQLEEAKRRRADYWFNGIAESVGKRVEKEEVPAEKLKFEQRKYMAAIDNPEKYSEKHRLAVDVQHNIFHEMKNLPIREVQNLIKSEDPFALPDIEGECEVVGEEHGEEENGQEAAE